MSRCCSLVFEENEVGTLICTKHLSHAPVAVHIVNKTRSRQMPRFVDWKFLLMTCKLNRRWMCIWICKCCGLTTLRALRGCDNLNSLVRWLWSWSLNRKTHVYLHIVKYNGSLMWRRMDIIGDVWWSWLMYHGIWEYRVANLNNENHSKQEW